MGRSVLLNLGTLSLPLREHWQSVMDVDDQLWNQDVGAQAYEGSTEQYQGAILEQYKVYVELMDRVIGRTPLIDTFFLTFNTAALAAVAALLAKEVPLQGSPWLLLIPLVPLLANCYAGEP